MDTPDDQRTCLENVLAINPDNERAKQGLSYLTGQTSAGNVSPFSACRCRHTTACTVTDRSHQRRMGRTSEPPAAEPRVEQHAAPAGTDSGGAGRLGE